MGGDPAAGGLGGGEGGDLVVGDCDGDQDAGVGEGAEDVGIDVEDHYAVYGCFVLEELRHLGWRREVVAEGAVVDADRVDGAGGGEEEEGYGRQPGGIVRSEDHFCWGCDLEDDGKKLKI